MPVALLVHGPLRSMGKWSRLKPFRAHRRGQHEVRAPTLAVTWESKEFANLGRIFRGSPDAIDGQLAKVALGSGRQLSPDAAATSISPETQANS